MKSKYIYLLLLCIVFVAAFLRFYSISSVPVSLYWDETASAYNAYSIAQTGRDEYGTPSPLLFRSFDDYKAPGNIYLTAIAVSLFGLNEFSTRCISALAGSVTVFFVFFLVKELLFLQKNEIVFIKKHVSLHGDVLGLLASFMLAISPWHIQFSRTGFEANVALAINVVGILLFLRGLRTHNKFNYLFAMSLFAVSFYFYRSVWVFLPMLISYLFFLFRKQLFAKKNIFITLSGIVLFVFILTPFLPSMLSTQGLKRASQVSVFTNSTDQLFKAAMMRQTMGTVGKIIYNQRIILPEIVIRNYLSHFSPQFLFISGDPNQRHGPRGMGVLYLWEVPFILIGLYVIVFQLSPVLRNLLLAWILVAPIPATLSIPTPHALRDLNTLPIPQIVSALGLFITFYFFRQPWKKFFICVMIIVVVGFFWYYLYLYYVITAKVSSAAWADGYKELATYMIPKESQYDRLVVSGHYWQPYIYFLFYKKFNPLLFQKMGSQIAFGKYIFGGTIWDKDKGRSELDNVNLQNFANAKNILVALSPGEYAADKNQLHYLTKIYNHNGDLVFIVGDEK